MSDELTKRCDASKCEQRKGEANRWWTLIGNEQGMFVTTTDRLDFRTVEPVKVGFEVRHACSESCVITIISQYMGAAHDTWEVRES